MERVELLCCIVYKGGGTKALRIARRHGVRDGSIFMGRGVAHLNKWLDFLELNDTQREILFTLARGGSAGRIMESIGKEMALHKHNRGICFSSPARCVFDRLSGTTAADLECKDQEKDQETKKKAMYNAIYIIVEKGKAVDVVEAASNAGARGGTIINARGAGDDDTSTVFFTPIEPERELVLILAESAAATNITKAVREYLEANQDSKGTLFVMDVGEAYGLY
jgi:nitrogen regulatory protein PII